MNLIKIESFYISEYKYQKVIKNVYIPDTSIAYILDAGETLSIHLLDKSVHYTNQTIDQLTSQGKKVKVKK